MPRLDEIADIFGGYSFKSSDLGSVGVAVVKIAAINPPLVSLASCQRVPPSKVVDLSKYLLKDRDIVMAMTGATTGKVGRYRGGESAYLNQRVAKLAAKRGPEFDDYVYAIVSQPGFEERVLNNASGSAQPNVSAEGIGRIEVAALARADQLAVGKIIAALDDKIELNRKMSATLEAMARALFKSWFVDFDPVRAKADSRDLGLPAEIAALFPDSFEESERGQVPKGWATRSLLSICDLVERGITPKYELGSRRFIVNQKVNRGSTLDLGALKELSRGLAIPTDKLTREFDVLVNCLGEGTLGRVHLFRGTTAYAVDQHMAICRPSVSHFGPLIYERLANPEGQAIIEASKTGTTGMTMLNISKLREFPVLWPGIALAETYGGAVASFWQRINVNDVMSRNLAAIRDSLLPKLISGEIRVTDAERILAATS